MSGPWQLLVYEDGALRCSAELDGPAELGRQRDPREKPPYWHGRDGDGWRVVVARLEENAIPRRCLRVEPLAGGRFRLTNLSDRNPVRLADGGRLDPNASADAPSPVLLALGPRALRLQAAVPEEPDSADLCSLSEATIAPGAEPSAALAAAALAGEAQLRPEELARWIQAALAVLEGAAGSLEFFPRAARAMVDLIRLDAGRVLLREGDAWAVRAAQAAGGGGPDREPSSQVLGRVLRERRTFWQVPAGGRSESLIDVHAVVAAPILDRRGEVIGALYGDRRLEGAAANRPITRLEAMLVEVLAGGVAAGLARLEQEEVAGRARAQLEHYFGRELYRELEARPDLLQARDVEVTILFCDIRGFGRVSERLGPAGTVEWIGDVMGVLSECVLARQGVVVEYIGDELMAMWGAPVEAPDQAARACEAARDMVARLPELNARWEDVLGERIAVGVGINTGVARVGNVGTKRKFKYGPLGNAVNLASRVQGATKYFRSPLLLTGGTRRRLGPGAAVRRLCRVRVVNIAGPVDLYELPAGDDPGWAELRDRYELALTQMEGGHLRTAVRVLAGVHDENPDDGPSLVLLSRAVAALRPDAGPFDPVWELPGK